MCLDRVVFLEIDEHSHIDMEVACELAKLDETRHAAENGRKPCVTIRYNPDEYDGRTITTDARLDTLVQTIRAFIA